MVYKTKSKTLAINQGAPLAKGLQCAIAFTQGKTQILYPQRRTVDWSPSNPAFSVSPFGPCPAFNNDTGLPLGNWVEFQSNAGASACWFKTSDSSQQYSTMISKNGAWALYNNFGILKGWIYGTGPGAGFVNTGINIADGKWHSVVYNYSVNYGCSIYLDGKLAVQQSFSIRDQFTQAQVGQETGADNFIGSLDLPMLWNRFLTPQEIQQYHQNPCQVFYTAKRPQGKVSNKLTGSATLSLASSATISELFGASTATATGTGIMGDMSGTGTATAISTGDLIEIAQAGGPANAMAVAFGNMLRSYMLSTYTNLIPPPNRIAPKYMLWVAANLQLYIDALNFTSSFIDAFFIQTAVGAQLDILGQILGLSRVVNFIPTIPADSPTLDDETYRLVLLAKIMQNQWRGTVQEVYNFWERYFPQYPLIIKDNQDMTMTVQAIGLEQGLLLDLLNNGYFVPKPAGVRINYSSQNNVYFAYDMDTDTLKGYGAGYWAEGA